LCAFGNITITAECGKNFILLELFMMRSSKYFQPFSISVFPWATD